MEHAQRHPLVIAALSFGEIACVRPVRWSIDAIAAMLDARRDARARVRVGRMSVEWLRQHDVDFGKHGS